MATRLKYQLLLAGIACCFLACNNSPSGTHGPIVLGDSSLIVTEPDPQKLKDLVTDLQPVIPTSENKEEEAKAQPAPDTAKVEAKPATATVAAPQQQQSQPLPNVPGLKAEFKEVSILIPGLSVKQAGSPNLKKNDAIYTLLGGEINGNTLKVSGNITKVSQRYQSVVILKNDMGTLPLETLSTTTGWVQVKGNGTYAITGLDAKTLDYPDADGGDIRNAVTKAAQRRRMSRKKVQEWVSSVRHVRSANQKPLTLMLRSVMWKIDGKDENGKLFSKQIRVDIPL